MPTSEVYLCDKQEDLPNDQGRACRKAVGDDGEWLVLNLNLGTERAKMFERRFCGRTHTNYWLIRQRLARDAGA